MKIWCIKYKTFISQKTFDGHCLPSRCPLFKIIHRVRRSYGSH